MIPIEICIHCVSLSAVSHSVTAVYQGGAARVELCSQMEHHGLTPKPSHVRAARIAFADCSGLMVMIRPRPGDFVYSRQELAQMCQQIERAAQAGADGVVLGVVENGRIPRAPLALLLQTARQHQLPVTFHRAFDALTDPAGAIPFLITEGVNRVLTSGTTWGSGETAVAGIARLVHYIQLAGPHLEIVIGGGITPYNAPHILRQLPLTEGKVSVHAYSAVQKNGVTEVTAVQQLCQAATAPFL